MLFQWSQCRDEDEQQADRSRKLDLAIEARCSMACGERRVLNSGVVTGSHMQSFAGFMRAPMAPLSGHSTQIATR